jgi:hypothetical protein
MKSDRSIFRSFVESIECSRPQPNLFAASGSRGRRPRNAAQLLPRVLLALEGRGWIAGAVLARELGTDLRALRAVAHESAGQIVGGDKGYCRTIEASPSLEDVNAVVNRHYSQARAMRGRAMEIERVKHSGSGGLRGGV